MVAPAGPRLHDAAAQHLHLRQSASGLHGALALHVKDVQHGQQVVVREYIDTTAFSIDSRHGSLRLRGERERVAPKAWLKG